MLLACRSPVRRMIPWDSLGTTALAVNWPKMMAGDADKHWQLLLLERQHGNAWFRKWTWTSILQYIHATSVPTLLLFCLCCYYIAIHGIYMCPLLQDSNTVTHWQRVASKSSLCDLKDNLWEPSDLLWQGWLGWAILLVLVSPPPLTGLVRLTMSFGHSINLSPTRGAYAAEI